MLRRVHLREWHLRPEHLLRRIKESQLDIAQGRGASARHRSAASVMSPFFTASVSARYVGPQFVSVPASMPATGAAVFIGRSVMRLCLEEVIDRAAIRCDKSLEAPVAPQNCSDQHLVCARRILVDGVVRAHDRVRLGLDDRGAESRQVCVPEIMRSGIDVRRVASRLRTAVDGVMLWRSDRLEVSRVITLQTLHKRYAEARRQEGIFTVRLLATAPARIAEDVDVRRPDGQARSRSSEHRAALPRCTSRALRSR